MCEQCLWASLLPKLLIKWNRSWNNRDWTEREVFTYKEACLNYLKQFKYSSMGPFGVKVFVADCLQLWDAMKPRIWVSGKDKSPNPGRIRRVSLSKVAARWKHISRKKGQTLLAVGLESLRNEQCLSCRKVIDMHDLVVRESFFLDI